MARLTTISFFGSVAANSNLTLVSKRITQRFSVKTLRAAFALNTNRTLQLRFFVSYDNSAPTTEEPQGTNILRQLGQVEYLVGDDDTKEAEVEIKEFGQGAYIKVYATNSDAFPHTVDTQVTIELGKPPDLLEKMRKAVRG